MRRSRLRRLAGVIASIAFACVIVAPAAFAKEALEAWLATPIPADAQPGDEVELFLTVNRVTDAGSTPLRGHEIVFRLYGPRGDVTEASAAEMPTGGTYRIRITVPEGGAARAEFGVRGTRVDSNGAGTSSDLLWPYDGVLVAAKVPPPVDQAIGTVPQPDPAAAATAATATTTTRTGTSTSGSAPTAVVLALAATVIVALALAAVVLAARRRLGHTTA